MKTLLDLRVGIHPANVLVLIQMVGAGVKQIIPSVPSCHLKSQDACVLVHWYVFQGEPPFLYVYQLL